MKFLVIIGVVFATLAGAVFRPRMILKQKSVVMRLVTIVFDSTNEKCFPSRNLDIGYAMLQHRLKITRLTALAKI